MANLNGFDANTVEPMSGDFEPLPAGQYVAMIVASEERTSKAGHGYLSLELEVIEGACKGRKLWVNLNLNHPSPDTVKFARAELAAICKAVGVLKPADSVQLHNLPMVVTVKCVNRKDTGELTNRIRGYSPKSAAAGQPPQQSHQQQQPAGNGAAPWRR
jgi:hypothetical protein